jgi:hypothetical protein
MCGTIVAFTPLYDGQETIDEVLTFVAKTFPTAQELPSYFVYDSACSVLKSIMPGRPKHLRWGFLVANMRWLVDRFHYFCHSPADNVCANNSDPWALSNAGLVVVVSRTVLTPVSLLIYV